MKKESNSYRVLRNLKAGELATIHTVLTLPPQGEGFSGQDQIDRKVLVEKVTEEASRDLEGKFVFQDMEILELENYEHDLIIKCFQKFGKSWKNYYAAEVANKVEEIVKNAETINPEEKKDKNKN